MTLQEVKITKQLTNRIRISIEKCIRELRTSDIITLDKKADSARKDQRLPHSNIRKINESKITFRCF